MAFTGRALAWLNLAWHFNRHIFVRLPKRALRGDDDAGRFRAAVMPEGYVPLLPAERALMPQAMRCINCGLCAFGSVPEQPFSAWDEPWTFVAGPSRSINRATIVSAGPTALADAAAESVCPTGVPIRQLAVMLHRLGADAAAATTSTEPRT